MMILLSFCLCLGILLSLFVLSPLFLYPKIILSYDKQEEGRSQIELWQSQKQELLERSIKGASSNSQWNDLTDAEALEALVDVCEKLETKGHSWKAGGQSLLLIFVSVLASLFPLSHARAQSQTLPPDVTIPPAFLVQPGELMVPSVNQYILIPDEGFVHVYYVGMFSNESKAKSGHILFPFPKGISQLTFPSNNSGILIGHASDEVILNTPLQPSVNQFQAEFRISAKDGIAKWRKNTLATLPGVVLFIMPEDKSILREALQNHLPNLNMWPPRFAAFPSDFHSFLSADVLKSNEKEGSAQDQSRQYVRVANGKVSFPEFEVRGIVPSRVFLYGLVSFLGCFLFGALFLAGFLLIRNRG
jgi:hypothetical protein